MFQMNRRTIAHHFNYLMYRITAFAHHYNYSMYRITACQGVSFMRHFCDLKFKNETSSLLRSHQGQMFAHFTHTTQSFQLLAAQNSSLPHSQPLLATEPVSCTIIDNNNNNHIQRRYSRFFTISLQRRELSPTRTLKWPGRNRVQHIERLSSASVMLCATWYEGTAQLLCLTELKSHLFELYFIG